MAGVIDVTAAAYYAKAMASPMTIKPFSGHSMIIPLKGRSFTCSTAPTGTPTPWFGQWAKTMINARTHRWDEEVED
jgi:hypothetical protein